MPLSYGFDSATFEISETKNVADSEFNLKISDKSFEKKLHEVRRFFDENKVHTDVIFYTHLDGHYQIIVRQEYYIDFLIQLFKNKIIHTLSWK